MPYPAELHRGDGEFSLRNDDILYVTTQIPANASNKNDENLQKLVEQTITRSLKTLEIKHELVNQPESLKAGAPRQAKQLMIHFSGDSVQTNASTTFPGEHYQISVEQSRINIECKTIHGLHRALATLIQLGNSAESKIHKRTAEKRISEKNRNAIKFPTVKISDQPRFVWRGLLIDSARHFFSVETIKRQIDGMAAAKLNVLHWHLTDDQGWRFESKKFPLLTAKGSDGEFYSQKDMLEIVHYADRYGIHVLPEIDMPGHTSALAVAHPELMTKDKHYAPEDKWGVHTPLLDPTKPEVYQFVDDLIAEVSEIFPFPYLHIGGDEVNPQDWLDSSHIQDFMREKNLKTAHELQLHFNSKVNLILKKYNKQLVGWDEIFTEGLDKNAVIQSWRGKDSLFQAAEAGYKALLSTGYYLDQPQPTAYHYRNDPIIDYAADHTAKTYSENENNTRYFAFSIPRKRGSNIEGKLAIETSRNEVARVVIQFRGKHPRQIQHHKTVFNELWFSLDTWMGPTKFELNFNPITTREEDKLSGRVKVGNAYYSLSGEAIPSFAISPRTFTLKPESMENVLGGEIALWSELIDEQSIDARLWPRAFAIAERLWSPADIRDEKDMQKRLDVISNWSSAKLDLKHMRQLESRIKEISANSSKAMEQIRILTESLEPAQYYHRHHEKSVNESYSRRDSLSKLADVLPSENKFTLEIKHDLAVQLSKRQHLKAIKTLEKELKRWNKNAQTILNTRTHGEEILSLAKTNLAFTQYALETINKLENPSSLTKDDLRKARSELIQHQDITEETIISAVELMEIVLVSLWDNAPPQIK